jgi:hypothetical protein
LVRRRPAGALDFGGTAALLYLICAIFVGNAIVELQAPWLVSTYLLNFPHPRQPARAAV